MNNECIDCGAETCSKCGQCLTLHNEDPVDNCPKNPSIIDRHQFDAHLKRASATVAQWPEWKRNLLG